MALEKDSITRPESPKVVRERKSRDTNFDSTQSPKSTRRVMRGELNLQKVIFEMNSGCWSQKYTVDDNDFAKGAYGKILLATEKATGQKVVIKKIPKSTPIRMVNNEVKAGKIIGAHPNIAALIQYFDADFHYLVFQYISAQDLFTYLEKLNFSPRAETEARSIITQILLATKHIHSHHISHRDIKLENILIDSNGKVTLIDLGLCAFTEESKLCRDWCGSDNYLAPEIVRRTPYDGYQADVFSTGVVLFALIYGVFPFENLRVSKTEKTLRKLQVRFPTDVKVSLAAKDLLTRMLEDEPEKRITMRDVLKHEWIVQGTPEEDVSLSSLKNSCESGPSSSP